MLAEASVKMKQLEGFHFVYEVHKPESAKPSAGERSSSIDGDVNAAGQHAGDGQRDRTAVSLINVDFVALGDTHYIKYPLSHNGSPSLPRRARSASSTSAAGTIRILDRITDTSYEGTEKKGGVEDLPHHRQGGSRGRRSDRRGGRQPPRPFPTDIWIGVEDSLLYEVDITGPGYQQRARGTWRSIVLSNLDVAVDIKAPQ